jgi:hypothetical protein
VLVLSETVLVIVIGKQLWSTKWVLDPCGISNSLVAQTLSEGLEYEYEYEYEQEHEQEHEHEDCQ